MSHGQRFEFNQFFKVTRVIGAVIFGWVRSFFVLIRNAMLTWNAVEGYDFVSNGGAAHTFMLLS